MTEPSMIVCSTSGGKDSTAVALLALDQYGPEKCRFVFADTGNEHQLTLEYLHDYLPGHLGIVIDTVVEDFTDRIAGKRHYIETVWPTKGVPQEIIDQALDVLHPTGVPFLDLCLWKGRFPSRKAQFCTQELKRRPLDRYMTNLALSGHPGASLESWQGVRRDESQNRRDALDFELTPEGWAVRRPIVSWTAQQVVDFVISRGVRLNPLYSEGFGRVGCFPCINCGKDELDNTATRYPQHIDKIREWERLVCLAARQGWTTFFCEAAMVSKTPLEGWTYSPVADEKTGEVMDLWIEPDASIFERLRIDSRVDWAKTTHGGKHYDLFKAGDPPMCSSMYGLCE